MAAWNLARFAETLIPLLHDDEKEALKLAQDAISDFSNLYKSYWLTGMRAKLGLFNQEGDDESLVGDLLTMMEKHKADYTNTFLALTFGRKEDTDLFVSKEFEQWFARWQSRLKRQEETKASSEQLMRNSNPAVIPRNHRVEEALEAAEHEDYSVMKKLLDVLANPYAHTAEQVEYAKLPEPSSCPYKTFCGT